MTFQTDSAIKPRIMGALPVLEIENRFAKAMVSLQGGQVLSYQPNAQEKVLWMSPLADMTEGKAIRGGVPVCWPWFGPRKEGGPNHGFARTELWKLELSETLDNGETRVVLSLPIDSIPEWDGKASLGIEVIVGETLKIKLTSRNTGEKKVEISQALHTYFTVSNTDLIWVEGLDSKRYLDEANEGRASIQDGDVTIQGEVDRTYIDDTDTCILHDPGLGRKITIKKSGSNGTVVWNPGPIRAEKMADVPTHDYKAMVCVETITLPQVPVELEPGQSHVMTAEIFVE
ncbi:D-hexose-6-phosphate mutarotase [Endozoicomonas numazuensis]|uniref:D-hexose-6-phosphate mutarotase n=1 Tax=Endozoicomonas numazuensis TaxID=1137799 RepID=UPI00068C52DA|nr:D-hexose-6-phosphate mutarotase [Endozoicomonas numazuensis]